MIAAPSRARPRKQSASVHDCDSNVKIAFLIGYKVNARARTSSKKARVRKIVITACERRFELLNHNY